MTELNIKTRLLGALSSVSSDRDLRQKYDQIHAAGKKHILRNNVEPDKLGGKRVYSVNLLIALECQMPIEIRAAIARAQQTLAQADPGLVLSPSDTLHACVFTLSPSFRKQLINPATGQFYEDGIYDGENFCAGNANGYSEILRRTLSKTSSFELEFAGIFATPEAVCIQGFDGGLLNLLRASLLTAFEAAGLRTPDWQANIAHLTIARYKQPLQNPEFFLTTVERLRTADFGTLNIDKFYLVKEHRTYLSEKTIIEELPVRSASLFPPQ